MELTTLEAIQYCIKEGIEGAENRLQSYERRERIDNSSVLEALIKDLLMIRVSCELKTNEEGVILKGSKRRFILGEKRSERAERLDKRKGNGASRDENKWILDELILKTILSLEPEYWSCNDTVEITTTALIKKYAVINPNEIEHKSILKIIQQNIFGEQGTVYAHTLTEYVRSYIRDTNRNVLTSALKQLEKTDRIILSYRYFVADKTGNNEVDEGGYNAMKAFIESEIDDYNCRNDTSFTLNALQKVRAKENRFLKQNERAFLKYMEKHCKVVIYKKNVIRILNKETDKVSREEAKQVYSEILLKRVKQHYITASTEIEENFFSRYKSFILAKVIESFGVKLSEWCIEYFNRYSSGFGSIEFHLALLTEDEKEAIGVNCTPYTQEQISSQLPF